MEAEVKQVIKEKEYVHDNDRKEYASKGLAGTALGIAIGAGVLSVSYTHLFVVSGGTGLYRTTRFLYQRYGSPIIPINRQQAENLV